MKILPKLFVIILMLKMNVMKAQEVFGRFSLNDAVFYGKILEEEVVQLTAAPWENGKETAKKYRLECLKVLHPSEPQVILGLGGSYEESWTNRRPYNKVRWFLKPPSSATGPYETVTIPPVVNALKVEVELTLIIGKTVKNVCEEEAGEAIFGYTIGNDIVGWTDSFHELDKEPNDQKEPLLGPGLKIGDGFAPFGPFIYTKFDWKNRERVMIIKDENGKERLRTTHNTSKLMYSPSKIVSDLSKVLTLNPGDVIMTGTNKSYVIRKGETVEISVEGLGVLKNSIEE